MPSKTLSITRTTAFRPARALLRQLARLSVVLIVLCVLTQAVSGQTPPAGANAATGQAAGPHAQPKAEPVSPQLMQLLVAWSRNSAAINKLHGEHHRFVYDNVFMVEKRATGRFYYEAPSKGRIDLEPADIPNGAVAKRVNPADNTPFKLQAERPERWICDGARIWQINDDQKQADVFQIPEEGRGQNMMDGPLPFLFGMPPEKALRRYKMELLRQDNTQAILKVLPRLQMDAANWKEAKVILSVQNWLPQAVQLIDPSGNLETVYTFTAFRVNAQCDPNALQRFVGVGPDGNPFDPRLSAEYKTKVHPVPDQRQPEDPRPHVPAVVNFPWDQAKQVLTRAGLTVKIEAGRPAPQPQFDYVVYEQDPPANTPLKPGQVVTLTVYNKASTDAPAAQPAAGNAIPKVTGVYWKDAGAALEKLGVTVKYEQGQVARNQQERFVVYQQDVPPGTPVKAGMVVKLTVFIDPPM